MKWLKFNKKKDEEKAKSKCFEILDACGKTSISPLDVETCVKRLESLKKQHSEDWEKAEKKGYAYPEYAVLLNSRKEESDFIEKTYSPLIKELFRDEVKEFMVSRKDGKPGFTLKVKKHEECLSSFLPYFAENWRLLLGMTKPVTFYCDETLEPSEEAKKEIKKNDAVVDDPSFGAYWDYKKRQDQLRKDNY